MFRKVAFQGINPEVEDQKAERRLEKLRKKKAGKMAQAARREDIRLFLCFLETVPLDRRNAMITEDERLSALVTFLFFDVDDPGQRLQELDALVRRRKLPAGMTRRDRDLMITVLGRLMDRWIALGRYDGELDRFLQFLRTNVGQGTLTDLLVSLVGESEAAREGARRLAEWLENDEGRVGSTPASGMPPEARESVRELKHSLEMRRAYRYEQGSVEASSSSESSDESETMAEEEDI